MEGLPENLPELEEPCLICLLTKATKIPRGPTTDVSKFAPGLMLQMDFKAIDTLLEWKRSYFFSEKAIRYKK